MFNRIYLSAPRRFRHLEFDFVEYMYAPGKFREGVVRPHPEKKIYLTNPERTVVDCADRLDLAGGYEEYVYNLDFVGEANEDKLYITFSLSITRRLFISGPVFFFSCFRRK